MFYDFQGQIFLFILYHEFFILQLLCVKLFRTDNGLCCIIDQNVQFGNVFFDVGDQKVDLSLRQEITLNYMQSMTPLFVVFLGFVTKHYVIGKTGSHKDICTVSQQFYSYLITDFDTSTCHQSSQSGKVSFLSSLLHIQLSARRTEIAIKMMYFAIQFSTDLTSKLGNIDWCRFHGILILLDDLGLRGPILFFLPIVKFQCLLVDLCVEPFLSSLEPLVFSGLYYSLKTFLLDMEEIAHLMKGLIGFPMFLLVLAKFALFQDFFVFLQRVKHGCNFLVIHRRQVGV